MASKVNREALGKNERRLMNYAATVLQGLKETNFNLIAATTLQLIQDQAIAQVVGWHSVETLRQRTELLELGLSKDQAEDLVLMKSSALRTQPPFRAHRFRGGNQWEKDHGDGEASNKGPKEKGQSPPKKKQ